MSRGLLLLFLTGLLVSTGVYAQVERVRWKYSIKKTGVRTYEWHALATIDEGWHIYAQKQPANAIALPVAFQFAPNPMIQLNGTVIELGKKEKYKEPSTGIEALEYSRRVEFVQKLTTKANIKTNITGKINYQVCNDEMCLPPKTETFSLKLE